MSHCVCFLIVIYIILLFELTVFLLLFHLNRVNYHSGCGRSVMQWLAKSDRDNNNDNSNNDNIKAKQLIIILSKQKAMTSCAIYNLVSDQFPAIIPRIAWEHFWCIKTLKHLNPQMPSLFIVIIVAYAIT